MTGDKERERDLVPLTVDATLATIEQDGVHIAAISAVWEGKHLAAALKVTLPPRSKKQAEPKTRTLRLTDPAERTGLAREILPHAKERGVEKIAARLEAGVDTVNLALLETRKRPAPSAEEEQYKVDGNRFWYRGLGGWQPLCNFAATITEEVIRDDGAEEKGELLITGRLQSGRPLAVARVPLDRFAAMNWPVPVWGTQAVVGAGLATKDHLREAMQLLSPDVVRRRVYAHTGWREIEGTAYYLHAGGAIGPDGPVQGIDVALEGKLGRAVLPEPPAGQELVEAVRASLGLLAVAPPTVMAPLLGAIYRAPLSHVLPVDASIYLLGASGLFKTELTALAQAHYGDFDSRNLLGAWSSTPNSLEKLSFLAKDIVIVVDDFIPTGTTQEIARCHAAADRFLRAVGNHAGRMRMAADGRLRPEYVPRSVVLSSGEELPRGHSLGARILVVDVGDGDVKVDRLTVAQAEAAQGTFRLAMAGYIRWLVPRFTSMCAEVPRLFTELREGVHADDLHARMPSTQAHLLLGWEMWLRFATECGAVTHQEATEAVACARKALTELVGRTQGQVADQEPAARFVKLLGACLSTGKAHLLALDGGMPAQAERWGWRRRTIGDTEVIEPLTRQHIGWIEGDNIYLDPDAAYAAAQQLAREQGDGCVLGPRTLWKRLHEKGLLASRDETRKRNLVRRIVQEARLEVLHLHVSTLDVRSAKTSQSTPSAQSGPLSTGLQPTEPETGTHQWAVIDAGAGENGPRNGPNGHESDGHTPQSDHAIAARGLFSGAESGPAAPRNGPVSVPRSGPTTREEEAVGPNGRIGPEHTTHSATEVQTEERRPCGGGCGRLTLHGWTCKTCIEGAPAQQVSDAAEGSSVQ